MEVMELLSDGMPSGGGTRDKVRTLLEEVAVMLVEVPVGGVMVVEDVELVKGEESV